MPKVYIVSNSGHDYDPAKEHGELIFMSEGMVNKFHLTEMVRHFVTYLKHSEPTDFVLPSGPLIMNIISCCLFVMKHHKINLLLYYIKAGRAKYILRRLNFKDLEELNGS